MFEIPTKRRWISGSFFGKFPLMERTAKFKGNRSFRDRKLNGYSNRSREMRKWAPQRWPEMQGGCSMERGEGGFAWAV
jgi:hypothetical protein